MQNSTHIDEITDFDEPTPDETITDTCELILLLRDLKQSKNQPDVLCAWFEQLANDRKLSH